MLTNLLVPVIAFSIILVAQADRGLTSMSSAGNIWSGSSDQLQRYFWKQLQKLRLAVTVEPAAGAYFQRSLTNCDLDSVDC